MQAQTRAQLKAHTDKLLQKLNRERERESIYTELTRANVKQQGQSFNAKSRQ